MSGTTAADQAARRARVQAQAQAQQQPQDSTHQPSRRRRIAVWSALVVALLVLASIGLAVQSTLTKPDTGVLDPQGKAIHHALEGLGFAGVNDVRQGKLIELDIADSTNDAAIEDMCKKLLANTVIENYTIAIA